MSKIRKVKRFEIQRLKSINGKEPEVIIKREQIYQWFNEMKKDKEISAVIPYLREVKQ